MDYFVTASYLHNDIGIENPTSSYYPIHDTTDQERLFAYLSYKIDDTSRLSLAAERGSMAISNCRTRRAFRRQFQLVGNPPVSSATLNENQNEQNYYAVLSYQKTAAMFHSRRRLSRVMVRSASAPTRRG